MPLERASIAKILRFPVKSMGGEAVDATDVTERGLAGDRIYGLIDQQSGKIASAKNPTLWKDLPRYSARIYDQKNEIVEVTFPSGTTAKLPSPDFDDIVSTELKRRVTCSRTPTRDAKLDRMDPIAMLEGSSASADIESHQMGRGSPPGTFFDFSPIHLMTMNTLSRIEEQHPSNRADAERYRPNLIISCPDEAPGFLENNWVGRILRIGNELVLRIVVATPRCVIPTLEHRGLPRDLDVLRVLVKNNMVDIPGMGKRPCAGAYAQVVKTGRVALGDRVSFG